MTTPLPMTEVAWGQKMPEGIRWSLNSPCSLRTVWPALLPPEKRATMWAFWDR